MIELIYNEEKRITMEETGFREPKNLRQVGNPSECKRIYVEDYVYTFLKQYAMEEKESCRAAVLLGNREYCENTGQLLIRSALAVEEVEERDGIYAFTEQIWGMICQECKEYFPEQEIIGWALSRPGFSIEKDRVIEETHRIYFSGADKVLFLMEPLEGESAFWGFDGNCFSKQKGYYIYYEKNEPMQAYLIRRSENRTTETEGEKLDAAMTNFRRILKEKQAQKNQRKKKVASYSRKSAVLLFLFVTAVAWQNRNRPLEESAETEKVTETQVQQVQETFGEDVVLEELPGQIPEEKVMEEDVEEPPVREEAVEENIWEESLEEAVSEPAAPETYEVQKGDTLAGICRNHYGNEQMIEEICRLNGITDVDYIQVGETILLP